MLVNPCKKEAQKKDPLSVGQQVARILFISINRFRSDFRERLSVGQWRTIATSASGAPEQNVKPRSVSVS